MPFSLDEIRSYLCCPDDGGTMSASAAGFQCERCHCSYPFLFTNILQFLPTRPITFPEATELAPNREGYLREFLHRLEIRVCARALGI